MRLPYLVIAAIVVVDGLYALLSPADLSGDSSAQTQSLAWVLNEPSRPLSPDPKALLVSGFWGDNKQPDAVDPVKTPAELAKEEAKRVRQRIRAIVDNARLRQVLFEVDGQYKPFSVGDILPGTPWRLLTIKQDSLILEHANEKKQRPRVLKLYSADALLEVVVDSADAEERSNPTHPVEAAHGSGAQLTE